MGEPNVRATSSRGYEISYEDAGAGPALVLVNGLTGTAAEWRELGFVDRLAVSHRVLSVDTLGHGLSAKPHDPQAYREPGVAADLIAAMDDAGVERAAVWGYSRGAWIACVCAIEFPDRVSSLIMGGEELTEPPSPDIPAWVEALVLGDWDAFWSSFPVELSEYDRQQIAANDPRAIGAAFIGGRQSPSPDLSRVHVPVLLYCGGGDDPQEMLPTAEALGVELKIVGDGDHFQTFGEVDLLVPSVLAHLIG